MNRKTQVCWLILLLLPGLSMAQSAAEWLEKGHYQYERDQLDSANLFYQKAFNTSSADDQLKAVAGLIKVAAYQSEMAKADSLVRLGDQISNKNQVKLTSLAEFKISRGEFFRKNSRFDQALNEQKEVIQMSAGNEEARLPFGNALYYTALTFERLAQYDSSLYYINRAYKVLKEEIDTTSLKFSSIYNSLGVCYYRANKLTEAKAFYLRSKAIAENKLGAYSSNLAMCLNNLSSISRSEQNYPEAIDYSERALKIYKVLEDEHGVSGAYYSLGVYHYYLGDYGRVKDYMEACIDIRERLFAPTHASLIGPYEVLGIAHEISGNYEKTLFYLQKVRKIITANYGASGILEGYNYENTAICYKSIGQLDSAFYYIQKANAILSAKLSAQDYALATHYFSYANILYARNELEKAGQMIRRSNNKAIDLGLDETAEFAVNLTLEGLILAGRGYWEQAGQQFELALDKIQMEEGLLQMSPNSLTVLNHYTHFLYQKYKATGEKKALDLFEQYSSRYLDLSDRFRKQFNDPYTKSALIKDNVEVYERNIGIYHSLYQQTQNKDYLKAAYKFSEYGRTSLLRDLQDDKIQSYAGVPDSVIKKEQQLKRRITELNQQLLDGKDDPSVKRALLAQKEALNTHIEESLKKYPKYHDLKFNSNIPILSEIQSQLGQGENLIEFMQDDTAYYALLLQPAYSELFYLGPRKKINADIKDWRKMITSRSNDEIGKNLYQRLWSPFEKKLSGNRVTIIPTGPLFYLNFEVLPGKSSAHLIKDYNISYGLSFSVLFADADPAEEGGIIAIAPGFEESIKQEYKKHLDSLETVDNNFLQTIRQPWSMKLVKALQKKFAAKVLTKLQASEAQVKSHIGKGQVLYFGTHAIADAEDPLRSKLVLAKEVGEQKEDGYLHAYELYGLPLQAELTVLNACESGLGNVQKGEGMISLAYSIHYAGCPSTVMSLWKVDEKTNTKITSAFLDYLDEGLSKSEALRQAKLDYLKSADPAQQHPFYWSGMVLMGQDGIVNLKGNNSSRWPIYLIVGFLLLLLILLIWYKK